MSLCSTAVGADRRNLSARLVQKLVVYFRRDAVRERRVTSWLSPHQARTLRKFSRLGPDWVERKIPGVGNRTWNTLITLGFLEAKGDGSEARLLRLTDKGRRVGEQGRY